MNNKEAVLYEILDKVIECCAMEVDTDGRMSLTKEDVLGKCRTENAVMTRCIFVGQMISAGYSVTTISLLLKRSEQAVRHLIELGQSFHSTSRAYRIADAEATLKCKEISAI